jgi:hypothetical protein
MNLASLFLTYESPDQDFSILEILKKSGTGVL